MDRKEKTDLDIKTPRPSINCNSSGDDPVKKILTTDSDKLHDDWPGRKFLLNKRVPLIL